MERTYALWTFHPSAFDLRTAERIDHTLGQYWNSDDVALKERYRLVLPMLHKRFGTDQLLWCDTIRNAQYHVECVDEIAWELNVPMSSIAAFYWVMGWEEILWGHCEDWNRLFVDASLVRSSYEIGALVRFPLQSHWVKNRGKPAPCVSLPHDVRKTPLWEASKSSAS